MKELKTKKIKVENNPSQAEQLVMIRAGRKWVNGYKFN